MAAKRCKSCKLVNPSTAMTCDCGYSFVDGSQGRPLDVPKRRDDSNDPATIVARRIAIRLVSVFTVGVIVFLVRTCHH